MGAVIGAGNGGDQLGGEGVVAVAEHTGDGLEHIDAGEVHMPQEGEEVALENGVVADIVLQEEVTREADAVSGAPIRDLGEKAFLVEVGHEGVIIVTDVVGYFCVSEKNMNKIGRWNPGARPE